MSGFGELVSFDITGDGAVTGPDAWPGDPAFLLVALDAGSCSVALEITTDDLTQWVQLGDTMTASGGQLIHVPYGVDYRVRVFGSSGDVSGHVDIFNS